MRSIPPLQTIPVAVDGEIHPDAERAELASLDEQVTNLRILVKVLDGDFDDGACNASDTDEVKRGWHASR